MRLFALPSLRAGLKMFSARYGCLLAFSARCAWPGSGSGLINWGSLFMNNNSTIFLGQLCDHRISLPSTTWEYYPGPLLWNLSRARGERVSFDFTLKLKSILKHSRTLQQSILCGLFTKYHQKCTNLSFSWLVTKCSIFSWSASPRYLSWHGSRGSLRKPEL